ncbi:MlaD family protein [Nocardia sp. NPDC004860]|uniref:MlaD family protein n=1 Tax=Nocardia sp. NPDC004860 TaxID=3154557 RepID=UPI0033ADFB7E
MKVTRKQRIATSVVVAAAVAAGTGFTVFDTITSSSSRNGFCAQMPDAVGLYAGNPVTQMGLQVGRIDQIQSKGGYVEVKFSLDAGRRYPADVMAVTRSKSILADRSLELVGNYKQGPELVAGQCVSPQRSFTPKSISEIAGSAADFIDALSPDKGKQSFQNAVAGMDAALRGQGDNARTLMLNASAAAASPDKIVADLGSIILNMAPLTDDALQHWSQIGPLLDQLPGVVAAGIDLWPGVVDTCIGIGWLVNVLHDVQVNYGSDLWPILQGPVVDAIHLAASRSGDIANLIDSIPSVAALMRQQSRDNGAVTIDYQPPTVQVDAPAPTQLCDAANAVVPGSCSLAQGRAEVTADGLLNMALGKGR